MIVTCTSCQARFRIPDEKIGPKGAKVRCSKCKNVFVARPAAGAGGTTAPPRDPFSAAPPEAPSDPFAVAGFGGVAAGPDGPPSDPFSAPG
ncbi:MAG TPA: zinc-ribbon domain-containing protein, partial [Anaeromyxobacteraceae bacterium]|nr:zinc-ribbon domain-containing protein [Anaeromyxobacteraceae bacterium]